MVKYLHNTIFILGLLNLTAAYKFKRQEYYNIKHQHSLENLVLGGIEDDAEKTADTQTINSNVEEYSKTRRTQRIHLDVENPSFKKLTLVIKNGKYNRPNHFNCEFSDCKIGQTNDDNRNAAKIIISGSKKKHTTYRDDDRDLKSGDDELNALDNIVNNKKQKYNVDAKARHDVRCEGDGCVLVKDILYRDDNDSKDTDELSSDKVDNETEFEQEAINDWTAYSKHKAHCKGKVCNRSNGSNVDNIDKSIKKGSLRKLIEPRKPSELLGVRGIKSSLTEQDTSQEILRAYDLMRIFGRLRQVDLEKVVRYIQNSRVSLADLNLDAETAKKFKILKHIYQNRFEKSDNFLKAAARGNLKNFIKTPAFSHNINDN